MPCSQKNKYTCIYYLFWFFLHFWFPSAKYTRHLLTLRFCLTFRWLYLVLSCAYLHASSQTFLAKPFYWLCLLSGRIIHSHLNPIESQLLSHKKIEGGRVAKKAPPKNPHKSLVEQLPEWQHCATGGLLLGRVGRLEGKAVLLTATQHTV